MRNALMIFHDSDLKTPENNYIHGSSQFQYWKANSISRFWMLFKITRSILIQKAKMGNWK